MVRRFNADDGEIRKNDLKRMVVAYEDVFTFHQDELERFKQLLKEVFD